jgi:hypothetical protein
VKTGLHPVSQDAGPDNLRHALGERVTKPNLLACAQLPVVVRRPEAIGACIHQISLNLDRFRVPEGEHDFALNGVALLSPPLRQLNLSNINM